mgnify:CR=1 FL=1
MARQPIDWSVVCEDESIFLYDVKVRSVWAIKGSKPRILTTGSHDKIVWFGSLAEDGTQLFRKYPNADSDAFLDFVKQLHKKYPKMILFIDKATYHKKEKRVKKFFRKHQDSIKVRWFPSGFPEANPVEECWNQGEDFIKGSILHNSFKEFKQASTNYFQRRRFKLNLYKYLCH